MDAIRGASAGVEREDARLPRVAHGSVFRWRSRTLHAYPTMLAIGAIAGIVTATRLAPWLGVPPGRTYAVLVFLLVPALAGSRLLFVVMHWGQFRDAPRRIWRTNSGGLALYGGLVLTLALSFPLLRALRLPVAGFWDSATIVILIGMAFTKVGCHLNGCCAGRRSAAWCSVEMPDAHGQRTRRLPAQLFEGALAVLLFALALVVRARLQLAGSLFLTGAIGYGAGRFLLEGMRDGAGRERDVTINRTISAVLAIVAAVSLWFLAAPHSLM